MLTFFFLLHPICVVSCCLRRGPSGVNSYVFVFVNSKELVSGLAKVMQ